MRLWGEAFSRMQREEDGQLVWTWVRREDVERTAGKEEDIAGLVEQLARSTGMRIALLFNEQSASEVKISCRTVPFPPVVDAARLMGGFGGGGHARAAGALVPGSLDDVKVRVLEEARAALRAARASAPA
jgi:phosphoesterase RecJ-like protein